MKKVWTGIESSGKDLHLSIEAYSVLQRNKRWLRKREKLGLPVVRRTMAFMAPMKPAFIKEIEDCGCIYLEFKQFNEISHLSQVDIFVGELLKLFPSSGSNSLTREQLDFITQGAKEGVHIYAASQDFSQVHAQFRRIVNECYIVTKVIGSRRPIASAPPVNHIWGICMVRPVSAQSFKGDNASMDVLGWPSFTLIKKEDTDRFDTSYKVPLSRLPDKLVRKQEVIGKDDDGKVVYKKTQWV